MDIKTLCDGVKARLAETKSCMDCGDRGLDDIYDCLTDVLAFLDPLYVDKACAGGKIGAPGPQSVEQADVTILKWQYLGAQDVLYEYVEVWKDGKKLASETTSIGVRNTPHLQTIG